MPSHRQFSAANSQPVSPAAAGRRNSFRGASPLRRIKKDAEAALVWAAPHIGSGIDIMT
jgi:hypothetical protein